MYIETLSPLAQRLLLYRLIDNQYSLVKLWLIHLRYSRKSCLEHCNLHILSVRRGDNTKRKKTKSKQEEKITHTGDTDSLEEYGY